VVAQDWEQRTAAGLGGEGEAAEKVEEAKLIAAAVEDVAELDGEGGPRGPRRRGRWFIRAPGGGGGSGWRDEAGEAKRREGLW
jgi:hypothetical protein